MSAHQVLNTSAEKARMEVTQFFNDIRRVIADRETSLKQKLSEQLKKEEQNLKKKEDSLAKHIKSVLTFYEEYQKSLSERDILLLTSSAKRIDIIKAATLDIEGLEFANPFAELNKENELTTIWRILHPSKALRDTGYVQQQGNNNLMAVSKGVKALNAQANAVAARNKGSSKDMGNTKQGSMGTNMRMSSATIKNSAPATHTPLSTLR